LLSSVRRKLHRWTRVAAFAVLASLAASAAAWSADRAWDDCVKKDPDLSVDGCSKVLARAASETTTNSPFAAALIKHLTTRGLEVGRLFRLVRDDVLAATERKQEPFVYGSLPGEELFFRPN
jgi:hypothetical protein